MSIRTSLVASLALLICSGSVVAAQPMPFHPISTEVAIPISSGCGLGVRRGPFDGCNVIYGSYYRYGGGYRAYRHGYVRGYDDGYRDGYYDGSGALMVDQGACSGRQMYPVCNIYGRCWAACGW
jgi:hypothetical protein